MTEKSTYIVDDEQKRRESAAQSKLAAMFATSKDEICIPKIYVDMVGDIPAAAVLDEVMFWTLPKPRTGKTSLRVKKNGVLWLAVRRTDWWERKRLTARQSDTAIEKLIESGLIEKDVWNFNGKPTVHIRMKMNKFVELYAQKMTELMENDAENDEENTIKDIQDLYEMMGMGSNSRICNLQNGEGTLQNGEGTSPNGEIINSPSQPITTTNASQEENEQEVKDKANKEVDYILKISLSPKAIQDAVAKFFQLTPNWEGNKFNRQWMAWAMQNDVTPAQLEYAANMWKSDKRFNWQQQNLKGIQEHWLELRGKPSTQPKLDANDSPMSYG